MVALLSNAADSTSLGYRRVPVLEVTEGFHSGARVPLNRLSGNAGFLQVGSGLDCDIVLSDAGVSDIHYRFSIESNLISVEARGGDIQIGGALIQKGQGYRCRLPVEVVSGGSRVSVGWSGREVSSLRLPRMFRKTGPFAGIGLVVALAIALPLIGSGNTEASQSKQPIAQRMEPQTALPPPDTVYPPDQVNVEQQLESKLQQLSLVSLKVLQTDRLISIEGTVTPEQTDAWQTALKWFDEHYGVSHALWTSVKVVPVTEKPELEIQAVWLGERPYVVTGQGEHIYPGAVLKDGWVLEEIEAENLVLTQRGRVFKLTL